MRLMMASRSMVLAVDMASCHQRRAADAREQVRARQDRRPVVLIFVVNGSSRSKSSAKYSRH
jgi:hypothetical protein